jgi:hypothetical protein
MPRIQHKATAFSGGSGSVTFDSNVTAGSTIVVCVGRNGATDRSFTVSNGVDTFGDVLNQLGSNNLEVQVSRAFNVAGGPMTVTVTASGTTNASIVAFEITETTEGDHDTVDEGSSSTSHVCASPAMSIEAGAFVVMMAQAGGGFGTLTHPSGYTQVTGVSGSLLIEYREFVGATTNDAAFSGTTSRQAVNCLASFYTPAGGGGFQSAWARNSNILMGLGA